MAQVFVDALSLDGVGSITSAAYLRWSAGSSLASTGSVTSTAFIQVFADANVAGTGGNVTLGTRAVLVPYTNLACDVSLVVTAYRQFTATTSGRCDLVLLASGSSYTEESAPPAPPTSLYRNYSRISYGMTRPWPRHGQMKNPTGGVVQYSSGLGMSPIVFDPSDTEAQLAPPDETGTGLKRYYVGSNVTYGPPNGKSTPLVWVERWGPDGGDATNFQFESSYPNRPKIVNLTLAGSSVSWSSYRFNSSFSEWLLMDDKTHAVDSTTIMIVGYLSNVETSNFLTNRDWKLKTQGSNKAFWDGDGAGGFNTIATDEIIIPSQRAFVLSLRPATGQTVISVRRKATRQQVASEGAVSATDLMLAGTSSDSPEGSHNLYVPEVLIWDTALDDTEIQQWEDTMVGKWQFGGAP